MSSKTTIESVAVSHGVHQKHMEDHQLHVCAINNCFIALDEHKCIAPSSSGCLMESKQEQAVVSLSDSNGECMPESCQSVPLLGQLTEPSQFTQVQETMEHDSDEEDSANGPLNLSNTNHMHLWLSVLQDQNPDDSNSVFEEVPQDAGMSIPEEDSHEAVPVPLPPLPTMNVRDFPQEDVCCLCMPLITCWNHSKTSLESLNCHPLSLCAKESPSRTSFGGSGKMDSSIYCVLMR